MLVVDRVVVHPIAPTLASRFVRSVPVGRVMYVVMRDFRSPSTMCSVCATRIAIVMPHQLILQKHVSVDRSTFDMLVAHRQNVIANMSRSVNVPYSWYIS